MSLFRNPITILCRGGLLILMSASALAGWWFTSANVQTTPLPLKHRVAVMVLQPHGFEPSEIEILAGRSLAVPIRRCVPKFVLLGLLVSITPSIREKGAPK